MITTLQYPPQDDTIEKIIRRGLTDEINKIIDEEVIAAQDRVAARISDMKTNAIGRILTKFKITRADSPEKWTHTIKFEV